MATWKRDFASGLIILVPLLVTVVVLAWIYGHLARVPIPVESGPVRVLLSLLIFILLVFSVGYLMRTAFGAVVERAIDDLMNQLPGLRVIYNASKMAVETALSGTSELQSPVRLEVWDGLRMTAFKTGKTTRDGREILFMPTAPNITTGFVIEVEQHRYEEVDDSVEDALTRLLSAGFGDSSEDPLGEILDTQEPSRPDEVSMAEASQAGQQRRDGSSENGGADVTGETTDGGRTTGASGPDAGKNADGGENADAGETSDGADRQ